MNDIYSTPSAELTSPQSGTAFGSIERGLAGDYDISVGEAFSSAWSHVKGAKGQIWIAVLITFAVQFLFGMVSGILLETPFATASPMLIEFGVQIISALVSLPLTAGLMLLGIRRAGGKEIRGASILQHYNKIGPLFITYLLCSIFIVIGIFLLVLPGIYLAVSYWFAMPLVLEKNLSPWQAMETSRKVVTKRWFTIFLIGLCIAGVMVISAIPLLIGWVWTLPLAMIITGVLYREMFGIDMATLGDE